MLEDMREVDGCDIEEFGALDSSEKTIAIAGDRWRPQAVKQDKGIRLVKRFYVPYGNNVRAPPTVGGVSIRSRNGVPSRKERVVIGRKLRQATNEYASRPPPANQ